MTMTDEKRLGNGCLDWSRHGESSSLATGRALRFLWLLRKARRSRNPLWRLMLHRMREGCGLEISCTIKISLGLCMNCGVLVANTDASALEHDFSYKPATPFRNGLRAFAKWYREYYGIRKTYRA